MKRKGLNCYGSGIVEKTPDPFELAEWTRRGGRISHFFPFFPVFRAICHFFAKSIINGLQKIAYVVSHWREADRWVGNGAAIAGSMWGDGGERVRRNFRGFSTADFWLIQ